MIPNIRQNAKVPWNYFLYVFGSFANLDYANLDYTNLDYANLDYTNLDYANLEVISAKPTFMTKITKLGPDRVYKCPLVIYGIHDIDKKMHAYIDIHTHI